MPAHRPGCSIVPLCAPGCSIHRVLTKARDGTSEHAESRGDTGSHAAVPPFHCAPLFPYTTQRGGGVPTGRGYAPTSTYFSSTSYIEIGRTDRTGGIRPFSIAPSLIRLFRPIEQPWNSLRPAGHFRPVRCSCHSDIWSRVSEAGNVELGTLRRFTITGPNVGTSPRHPGIVSPGTAEPFLSDPPPCRPVEHRRVYAPATEPRAVMFSVVHPPSDNRREGVDRKTEQTPT